MIIMMRSVITLAFASAATTVVAFELQDSAFFDQDDLYGSYSSSDPYFNGNDISVIQAPVGQIMPDFAEPIQNTTVNVGREAVLECKINNLGKYKVGWLKANDQTILTLHNQVITNNPRIGVDHEERRIWRLKIRHVEEADRGCYMCQINTESMIKEIGCIDVLIPPDIDYDATSSDVTVSEGEDAFLLCEATGHPMPKIKWMREDKTPFTVYRGDRKVQVTEYHGRKLHLRKVKRQEMGAYLCIASNDVPPAVSKRVILNVNFHPEVTVPSQLFGVAPGSDVILTCNVQAYPEAISYWMKNDMILHNAKYNVTEKRLSKYEWIMYLAIRNWTKQDEAHFTCMATNSIGSVEGRIQTYTYETSTVRHEEEVDVTVKDYDYIETTQPKRDDFYFQENNRKAERHNYYQFTSDDADKSGSDRGKSTDRQKSKTHEKNNKKNNQWFYGNRNEGIAVNNLASFPLFTLSMISHYLIVIFKFAEN